MNLVPPSRMGLFSGLFLAAPGIAKQEGSSQVDIVGKEKISITCQTSPLGRDLQ